MVKICHLWSCYAKSCKKNNSMCFLCQHWFLNQKGILLTFLVNILALLTFGQSFDFVDLFSKKCKSEKYHGAKLGYDSCPYLISLNHKNANSPGIRILLVEDN